MFYKTYNKCILIRKAGDLAEFCCSHTYQVFLKIFIVRTVNIFRMSFYGSGPRIKESQLGDKAGEIFLRMLFLKTDSSQSSRNKCKNYLLKSLLTAH